MVDPQSGGAERHYARRLVAVMALLAVLLVATIGAARGRGGAPGRAAPPASPSRAAVATTPRCADESRSDIVAVIAQTPNGSGVPLDSPIAITFSCPLDQRAVERAFVVYPPTGGTFSWRDRTLVFTPDEPWLPLTTYRVSLFDGLSDSRGFVNGRKVSWPFVTRATP